MDPLEWVLAFVNQISGPAKAMTGSVRELTKALKELQGVSDKLKPIVLPGMPAKAGATAKAKSDLKGFADMWSKIGNQMQREQEKFTRYRIALDRKLLAEKERTEKAMLAAELRRIRTAQREEEKRAKATERASHKWYLGGHKTAKALVKDRFQHKVGGLAGGAADTLLGAPSAILGGAVSAVGTIVEGTAKAAFNLGKMAIAAQSMREEAVEGFTAIYKDAEVANNLFDQARTVAKQTKFETPQVIARFQTLAARGFEAKDVAKTYWSIADIETARGYGIAQRYERSLANLHSTSKPAWVSFKQGADASVGTKVAVPELGKLLGLKETGGKLEDKVRQMFRDGKISGDVAMQALIAGTNNRYNAGGESGGFAKKQGDKTWAGAISNIMSGMGDVLNMRLPENHAINKFKTLLQAIGSSGGLFDQTSDRGKRFEKLVSDFVSDIFMPFGGITLDNTGDLMDKLLTAGEELRKKFHEIMESISVGANSFLNDAKAGLISFAADIGIAVGKGIVDGILGISSALAQKGAVSLQESLTAKGTILGWAQDKLDNLGIGARGGSWKNPFADPSTAQPTGALPQHSTSFPAAGMSVPMQSFDTGGEVPGPYGRPQLAIVHGKERIIGLGASKSNGYGSSIGGQGSMGASGPPQVNVHFHGNVGADPGEVQEAIKQATYAGYMQALEEAATAQGVL